MPLGRVSERQKGKCSRAYRLLLFQSPAPGKWPASIMNCRLWHPTSFLKGQVCSDLGFPVTLEHKWKCKGHLSISAHFSWLQSESLPSPADRTKEDLKSRFSKAPSQPRAQPCPLWCKPTEGWGSALWFSSIGPGDCASTNYTLGAHS